MSDVFLAFTPFSRKPIMLEPNISHLAENSEFKAKVERAFNNQYGFSRRIHWKPYGWIAFVSRADGSWIGFLEADTFQTMLVK